MLCVHVEAVGCALRAHVVFLNNQLVLLVAHQGSAWEALVLAVTNAVVVFVKDADTVAIVTTSRRCAGTIASTLWDARAVTNATLVKLAVARNDHLTTDKVPRLLHLIGAHTQGENLSVQRAGQITSSGDLSHQPPSVGGKGVGCRVEHIPRSTREGVHIQFSSSGLEVPAHCWGERCILHQRRILCTSNASSRSIKSDGCKAVVSQVREEPEEGCIDARSVPRRVQCVVVNPVRGAEDQRHLVVSEHRRNFV